VERDTDTGPPAMVQHAEVVRVNATRRRNWGPCRCKGTRDAGRRGANLGSRCADAGHVARGRHRRAEAARIGTTRKGHGN
jgi:hypothetical protein